jgi:hypothetical protein
MNQRNVEKHVEMKLLKKKIYMHEKRYGKGVFQANFFLASKDKKMCAGVSCALSPSEKNILLGSHTENEAKLTSKQASMPGTIKA